MKKKSFFILSSLLLSLGFLFAEEKKDSADLNSYISLDENFTIEHAILYALNNNPDILIQKAVLLNASGQLLQAKGNFDVKVGAETSYSRTYNPYDEKNLSVISGSQILYDTIEGQEFGAKAYVEKLFAFGIDAKLNYQISRSRQIYENGYYEKDPYYASYGSPDFNSTGNISAEISIPLLKGFNEALADNNLKMAEAAYEGFEYSLKDTVSKVIMQTSEAYWNYYTAYEKIKELEKMVQKNDERVSAVGKLVASGLKTKNEQLRIQVNALSTKRQLETAKIEYMTSKTNLASQIGIPVEIIADPKFNLPDLQLEGEFPKPEDFSREKMEAVILSRPDMISLERACDAAALKVKVAKINARPDLDFSFQLGTTGAKYGNEADKFTQSTFSNVRGLNYGGKLSLSMPLQNNQKKGAVEQAEAEYSEALAKFDRQKNTFILQLQNSINALNIYRGTVLNAKDILDSQEQVYINEQKRYDAGLSSVDNLLDQDSAWIEAKMNYYQIYESYLRYVLEYKYYTSTLLNLCVDAEKLYGVAAESN